MTTADSRPRLSRRTWLGLLLPVVLLAAYWGITRGVRAHVDGLIAAAVGKPLPAFALADGSGRTWTAAELRGRRVVLHFFRSRCHSCDLEAPALRAFEAAPPADTVVLHVMTDLLLGDRVTPAETARTLEQKAFRAPVLMADAAFLGAFHQVQWSNVTPISYVIDRDGVIRYGLRGQQTAATLAAAVAALP